MYLSAHSSLALALLYLGRWGEMLEVLTTGYDTAAKNGNTPWLGVFRALRAWLRYKCCDHGGARREAEILLATHTEANARQVETMCMFTAGFGYLGTGEGARSLELFRVACGRGLHPRFFLDWYWRIIAQIGLSHALLSQGLLDEAAREADVLIEAAAPTADFALKALAWDIRARIAMASGDSRRAAENLGCALAAVNHRPVPFAAWVVHAAAAAMHAAAGRQREADGHCAQACGILERLADSFPEDEPLRRSLLAQASQFGA